MREFKGRVAVVTGGASGIGKAVARRLAEEGMSVVLADFERAALEATAREFTQAELDVHPVFVDVSKQASVAELRDECLQRYGAVHVLFNNAGVAGGMRVPIWETPDEDWDWMFPINFWGVVHGIRAFVPAMLAHGEPGHIINTASVAGLIPGNGIYGVTKHAVVALSESLYQHLHIVNARLGASVLCPPVVRTQIFESERNRPGVDNPVSLATPELLEDAWEPEAIGDAVLAGIADEQFYIIPQSRWDARIDARCGDIVARHNPRVYDNLTGRRGSG